MQIIPRHIIKVVLSRLENESVLALTGARQTGKTTFCRDILPQSLQIPFSYISFDDPEERLRTQSSAVSVLEGLEGPLILLDEVQKVPDLFDPLKLIVDRENRKAAERRKTFVLTGSSQLLLLRNIRESLAGRVALVNLHPFSLAEAAECGPPRLFSEIWAGKDALNKARERFRRLSAERSRALVRVRDEHQKWGGYPSVWQRKDSAAKISWLRDYRKTYLERDVADVGQVADIDTFALAQKLLCARTAGILSLSEVARDLGLSVNTVKRYVSLLTLSFQCHLLRPYYENVGKRFIRSPKIYFPDPGINDAVLGEMAVSSGAAYESWVFSEIIKWKDLQPRDPGFFFYRTSAGLEVDFLLKERDKLLPLEVKFSANADSRDGRSLDIFMREHKNAPAGIIIYRGREFEEVRRDIWAVPDWFLFTGE
jgi:predicted AAA+ superfamily ATPase